MPARLPPAKTESTGDLIMHIMRRIAVIPTLALAAAVSGKLPVASDEAISSEGLVSPPAFAHEGGLPGQDEEPHRPGSTPQGPPD